MVAGKAPKGAEATELARKRAASGKKVARKKAASKKPATAKKAARSSTAKAPGRPGTAGKAEGHDAVLAYLARQRKDQRAILERIDKIVLHEVPEAKCAIKWSTPMYGQAGKGWFAAMAAFKAHVAVNFFNGVELKPVPPGGQSKSMRSVRIETMADLDEEQLADWMRQAASIRGWGKA